MSEQTTVEPEKTQETVEPSEPEAPREQTDAVSRADHQRALSDMMKYKKKVEALENDKKRETETRLREQAKWQELAETMQRERDETIERMSKLSSSIVERERTSALRVKAMALGLRSEAVDDLDTLDLSELQVETTNTGRMSVLGVDKFAERLKTQKPHWFADRKPVQINTRQQSSSDDGTAPITAGQLLAAEKEAAKGGEHDAKYKDLFKRYQQQRLIALKR